MERKDFKNMTNLIKILRASTEAKKSIIIAKLRARIRGKSKSQGLVKR